jgi:cysteine synthase A
LLGDVSFDWQGLSPTGLQVSAQESFAASVKLLRRGILGGPSSGMNYAGLLKHLEKQRGQGLLQRSSKEGDDTWCVFLCCDSPLPHVAEYFETLGEDFFPRVHEVPEEDEQVSHN